MVSICFVLAIIDSWNLFPCVIIILPHNCIVCIVDFFVIFFIMRPFPLFFLLLLFRLLVVSLLESDVGYFTQIAFSFQIIILPILLFLIDSFFSLLLLLLMIVICWSLKNLGALVHYLVVISRSWLRLFPLLFLIFRCWRIEFIINLFSCHLFNLFEIYFSFASSTPALISQPIHHSCGLLLQFFVQVVHVRFNLPRHKLNLLHVSAKLGRNLFQNLFS